MKLFGCLLAIVVCLGLGSAAHAQQGRPGVGYGMNPNGTGGSPTVSPYIGLGGITPGINYLYNIRPQLELRALLNRQQGEINDLERRNNKLSRDPRTKKDPMGQEEFTLPRTGHRVYFSSYSHYYIAPAGRSQR